MLVACVGGLSGYLNGTACDEGDPDPDPADIGGGRSAKVGKLPPFIVESMGRGIAATEENLEKLGIAPAGVLDLRMNTSYIVNSEESYRDRETHLNASPKFVSSWYNEHGTGDG